MNRREIIGGLSVGAGLALAGMPRFAAAAGRGDYTIVPRDVRDMLGEGTMWSPRRNTLFWVDIERPTLWSMDYASGRVSHWPMPEAIGWIVEREGRDDFIVGMKSGFATLKLDPFELTLIGNPEPNLTGNRLNDAKVDRWGRIWAGTLGRSGGSLYRLDPDLTWSRQDTGYAVCNGPTFSVDGNTMYHNDTPRGTVYAMDLQEDGSLKNKRVFIQFEKGWGVPDGMTTDAEGGLWICCWDGGQVGHFHPDGTLDRFVKLPASRITDCAFTGPDLDTLFVSSAATGKAEEKRAGSLFRLVPGETGMIANRFAG